MHRMPFWRMFARELDEAICSATSFLRTPIDLREHVSWNGPSRARRSFRNAFAACWDMLDDHPGDQLSERWELD